MKRLHTQENALRLQQAWQGLAAQGVKDVRAAVDDAGVQGDEGGDDEAEVVEVSAAASRAGGLGEEAWFGTPGWTGEGQEKTGE